MKTITKTYTSLEDFEKERSEYEQVFFYQCASYIMQNDPGYGKKITATFVKKDAPEFERDPLQPMSDAVSSLWDTIEQLERELKNEKH